jgi:hypothetical protein
MCWNVKPLLGIYPDSEGVVLVVAVIDPGVPNVGNASRHMVLDCLSVPSKILLSFFLD